MALAALLAALLVLPALGAAPFDDPGEGQHAEIAREAWRGGGWLTLRLNGVRYLDKPPLLYALIASAFQLWGVSEWAARLAPALGAVLAVAATAACGARLAGPLAGFAAGAALLGCIPFAAFARYVRPETLFVALIQLGFAGILGGDGGGGTRLAPPRAAAWLAGCAALGLASLVKDPLGAIGPLAALAAALALSGQRPISRRWALGGLGVTAVLGGGWYAAAALASPGFAWYTVVDNHLLNALRLRRFPDADVPLGAGEFLAVSALGAFPWVIGAALMAASLVRRRAWRVPGETAWTALGLWAAGVIVLFVVVAFRLPHYALPAYPAIVLLAIRWWTGSPAPGRGAIAAHAVAFAVLAAVAAGAAASDGRAFSEIVLSATDVATRKEAVLGGAEPAIPWEALRPLLARAAAILAVGAAGLTVAAGRRAPRLALAVMCAAMVACVPVVATGVGLVASGRAVRAMAAEVARQAGPGVVVVHEGPIEESGALELYAGRRPVLLDATRSVLGFGAMDADVAGTFWSPGRLRQELAAGRPLLLLTPRPAAQSALATLPPASLRLLRAHNGRRLYASPSVPVVP